MRISEACAKVHLTERAVRLYIREGLVQPGQRNGITVFDERELEKLQQVGVLRRADFSIPQIRRMLENPDEIGAVIEEKVDSLKRCIDESQELLSALKDVDSLEQLVEAIQSAESPEPGPIRTSLDEPLPSEADIQAAWRETDAAERRKARNKKLIPVYIAAALAILIALISFEHKLDDYAEANSAAYSNSHLQQKLREILELRPDS